MSGRILWFRQDLRLTDNPVLLAAASGGETLLPVFCLPPDEPTPWGFARVGQHRQRYLTDTLIDLQQRLRACGSDLLVLQSHAQTVLPTLARDLGITEIHAEDIPAPEEQAAVAALRAAGLQVHLQEHSALLHAADLPFPVTSVPDVFSAFRRRVEQAGVSPRAPLPMPASLPPLPSGASVPVMQLLAEDTADDPRSAFPFRQGRCRGGETAALAHVQQYFAGTLPCDYKATRNGLTGIDYSSKLSPWLATGAISPRTVFAALRDHEADHGVSDGSYWLWFELLWRDHFRLLHRKHGVRLYRGGGLGGQPPPPHHAGRFAAWAEGRTGEPLVDAGMRDLAATGFLSNRLRQIVASYFIHDLGGDWRAGAAWFESQLVDYDVCSNQGNWLYLAGRGTDPRGSRRFNPQKQAADYDADGAYRRLWGTA